MKFMFATLVLMVYYAAFFKGSAMITAGSIFLLIAFVFYALLRGGYTLENNYQ